MKTHQPTLADHIIEVALDKQMDPFSRGMAATAMAEIRTSQRFVMSLEVREAVKNLLTSRPTAILEALQWCRPPFERVWMEWPTPDQPDPKHAIRVRTTRVGAGITAISPRAFRFFTAWTYSPKDNSGSYRMLAGQLGLDPDLNVNRYANLGISSLEVGIDLDATMMMGPGLFKSWSRPQPMRLDTEYLQSIRDDEHNSVRHALKDMREREAIGLIEKMVHWRLRRDPASQEMAAVSQSFGSAGVDAALDDVKDEIGPVIAMLIMMNARNCVELGEVPNLSKLNKARQRRGKPEYVEYKTVHIRFSAGQERAAKAQGMTPEERKRHIVRGHFKTRKTGVFWWPAHLRGSAAKGYIKHEAYVMDHAPG